MTSFLPMEDAQSAARLVAMNREVSNALLHRLLIYHGRRPPDAAAASAVDRIRTGIMRFHSAFWRRPRSW